MRSSLLTLPIWLMGDQAEAIAGALLGPLCDPLAGQASMGYREALGLLAGLLCVLVMGRRYGNWPGKWSRGYNAKK